MQEKAAAALTTSSRVRKRNQAFLIQEKAFAAQEIPRRARNAAGIDPKTLFSVGSVVAGLGAAAACAVPLMLLGLGISGAWIGDFNALYPYRPYLIATALVLLAGGVVTVYGKSNAASCEAGTTCPIAFGTRFNKAALWVSTVLITAALGLPYAAPWLLTAV